MIKVHDINLVVTGQTADLVPMDKAIYALRDVTATVSSIPLIASSIMSKKIAGGSDKILIDIKVGNGALLTNEEDAKKLSDLMIKIGKVYHKEVRTMISDMNVPLGNRIGNSLEVLEAIDVLKGEEKNNNFVNLCFDLSSEMISMGLNISKEDAFQLVNKSIEDQSAYGKFVEMVNYQNGDISKIKVAKNQYEVLAKKSGVLTKLHALELGKLSLALGAGKVYIDDKIDYSVGIYLKKQLGDSVKKGDVLAVLYYNDKLPKIEYNKIFTID